MPGNGHTKKETRSRNSRAQDTEGQRFAQGCAKNAQRKAGIRCRGKEERKSRIVSGGTTKKGSRKDAREVHREEHGAKAPRTQRRKDGT